MSQSASFTVHALVTHSPELVTQELEVHPETDAPALTASSEEKGIKFSYLMTLSLRAINILCLVRDLTSLALVCLMLRIYFRLYASV